MAFFDTVFFCLFFISKVHQEGDQRKRVQEDEKEENKKQLKEQLSPQPTVSPSSSEAQKNEIVFSTNDLDTCIKELTEKNLQATYQYKDAHLLDAPFHHDINYVSKSIFELFELIMSDKNSSIQNTIRSDMVLSLIYCFSYSMKDPASLLFNEQSYSFLFYSILQ